MRHTLGYCDNGGAIFKLTLALLNCQSFIYTTHVFCFHFLLLVNTDKIKVKKYSLNYGIR